MRCSVRRPRPKADACPVSTRLRAIASGEVATQPGANRIVRIDPHRGREIMDLCRQTAPLPRSRSVLPP